MTDTAKNDEDIEGRSKRPWGLYVLGAVLGIIGLILISTDMEIAYRSVPPTQHSAAWAQTAAEKHRNLRKLMPGAAVADQLGIEQVGPFNSDQ